MSDEIGPRTWLMGIMALGIAGLIGHTIPQSGGARSQEGPASSPAPRAAPSPPDETRAAPQPAVHAAAFTPLPDSSIPDDAYGAVIRLGERIFRDTAANAPAFVGNDLRCTNCHLDRGRLGDSAPLWAAYVKYPAYRAKNGHVNTFAERLQGCFRYSMNGKAPPLGDPVLVALETYAAFLAHGAPVGVTLPGQGYPRLPKPKGLDIAHGREVYAAKCALCHGADGAGQASPDGTVVFPPLWGARSYNWGAGMSSVANAAGFIKANMPLSQGGSLTDAEAWDVAAFIDSRERPQDPRFDGSVANTRAAHHDSPFDFYGKTVDGTTLGDESPPSGTVPR